MHLTRRLISVAILPFILGLSVMTAPSASAGEPADICKSVVKNVRISSGAAGIELGGQHITLNLCITWRGTIRSSSVEPEFWTGPEAAAAGWTWTSGTPSEFATAKGTEWTVPYSGRGCAATQDGPLCTDGLTYETVVMFYSPRYPGPRQGDASGYWRARCTGAACTGDTFEITG